MDSVNVFTAKANLFGMDPASLQALLAGGIDTLSRLAFCSTYQQGNAEDAALIAVLSTAIGGIPSAADASCFRRSFWEASTMTLSEMRHRLERPKDAPPRRLPQAERNARYEAQCRRLPGFTLTGERECSHALIDAVFQMREEEVVRYLPASSCSKRDQELAGTRSTSLVSVDKAGMLRQSLQTTPHVADTSSELCIRSALERRCLAFDQADLIA